MVGTVDVRLYAEEGEVAGSSLSLLWSPSIGGARPRTRESSLLHVPCARLSTCHPLTPLVQQQHTSVSHASRRIASLHRNGALRLLLLPCQPNELKTLPAPFFFGPTSLGHAPSARTYPHCGCVPHTQALSVKNIRSLVPLLDRVLVQRAKQETVSGAILSRPCLSGLRVVAPSRPVS